jgi:hypothetical protein
VEIEAGFPAGMFRQILLDRLAGSAGWTGKSGQLPCQSGEGLPVA